MGFNSGFKGLNVSFLCSHTHWLSNFLKQETNVTELCCILTFVMRDYAVSTMI